MVRILVECLQNLIFVFNVLNISYNSIFQLIDDISQNGEEGASNLCVT